jgi:pilus assembly protein CpaF
MAPADDLEVIAGALRDELVARAGDDVAHGDVVAQIRALVDERAGILDAASRDELARRVAQRSFGLGPLESLLADPDVDEVMVCGTRPSGSSAAGASSRRRCRSPTTPSCCTRSSGSSRRSDGAWTRPSRSAMRDCRTARA